MVVGVRGVRGGRVVRGEWSNWHMNQQATRIPMDDDGDEEMSGGRGDRGEWLG